MRLTADEVALLRQPRVLELLAEYDGEPPDRVALRLGKRRDLPPARLLADQVRARAKLFHKVPAWRGLDLLAHPRAVEQCSSQATARHRCRLLPPAAVICDPCCGLGVDACFAASDGRRVLAGDLDPALGALLRHNAAILDLALQVGGGDALAHLADTTDHVDVVLCDPDRRPGGQRSADPRQHRPPLPTLLAACRRRGCASLWKLAPGVDRQLLGKLLPGADRLQLISVDGEARECLLRCPAAPADAAANCSAVLLWPDGRLRAEVELPIEPLPLPPSGPVDDWIFQADVAIRQLGGLAVLAQAHDLRLVSAVGGLLTGPEPIAVFPGRSCRVLFAGRWHQATVKRWCRDHGIRHANANSRGADIPAVELLAACGLRAGGRHDLYSWRSAAGQQIVIGERATLQQDTPDA